MNSEEVLRHRRFYVIIHLKVGDDMKKFKVTSYHKSNALMPSNGGTLIITDTEYIIKYLFITVAKYKIDDKPILPILF